MATISPTATSKARLDRWRAFLGWIDDHSDTSWVFRGLGDTGFQLIPGAGRAAAFRDSSEKTILEVFERRAAEFMDLSGLSRWDRMAIAQHHGLPTRLLDWTTNPLVGAYFAVSALPSSQTLFDSAGTPVDAVPSATTVSAKVIAFRVRSSMVIEPRSDPDPFARGDVGFLLPRSLTTRIVTQGGLFSHHPHPSTAWVEPLANPKHSFEIPGDMRGFFRRRLFYLGVEPQRIMGGLDGVGGRLAWQYTARIGLGAVR